MSILWDEDEEEHILKKLMTGESFLEHEMTNFIKKLSQLPFTEHIKSEAWYKILKDRPVERLSINEWSMYEALIPFLPPDLLLSVNFTNEEILEYFGNLELKQNQLSLMAEKLTFILGLDIMQEKEIILKIKNIFCGFSPEDMEGISAQTFRFLLEKKFFKSIKGCRIEHLTALTYVTQKYPTIGPPRTWSPELVESLGNIVAGLSGKDIRSIRRRSFSKITPDVIKITPQSVLTEMKNEQLMALNKRSLLEWRRKTKDLRPLNNANKTGQIVIVLTFVLITNNYMYNYI